MDNNIDKSFARRLFNEELVDLGEHEDPRFSGVMTPKGELGVSRAGVSATFLDNAETYFQKYEQFGFWKAKIQGVLAKNPVTNVKTIIEYGCGFGNSTIPLLEMFPSANVVAMDISPNLLSILNRLIADRGYSNRCIAISQNAQKPYLHAATADLVVGSAILHHLVEPEKCVEAAMRVLKPGGLAIFFEPFESGHAILRVIIAEICHKAAVLEFMSPALTWLAEISTEWNLQIQRDKLPNWHNLDDKWLFPRSVLQKIADDVGAELIIAPILGEEFVARPFATNMRYFLKHWQDFDPDDETILPRWVWEIVDKYDNGFFSNGLLEDFQFQGSVVFKKR